MRANLFWIIGVVAVLSLWSMNLLADQKTLPKEYKSHRLVDAEVMFKFLEKHEPKIARSLDGIKKKDIESYKRKVDLLRRIYSPIVRQMEKNPELGKLSLKRLSLNARIESCVIKIRDNKSGQKKLTGQLKAQVSELFDLLIKQEEIQLNDAIKDLASVDKKDKTRQRLIQEIIDRQKKAIQFWRSNKDKIVEQRFQSLVNAGRVFPW